MEKETVDCVYSAQFFGFTPRALFREFSEMVVAKMAKVTKAPQGIIVTQKLYDVWSNRAILVLSKLESFLFELLIVPKNVLLPEDSINVHQYTEEEIKNLEKEVNLLEKEYDKEIKMAAKYKLQIELLDQLKPVIKKVKEDVEFVDKFQQELNEIIELEKLFHMYQALQTDTQTNNNLLMYQNQFTIE